jgi:hypothetical protein
MYPVKGRYATPRTDHPHCLITVRAVCPECHTSETVTQIHVSDECQALYHSCSRCRLVWGTDFAGTPINKH